MLLKISYTTFTALKAKFPKTLSTLIWGVDKRREESFFTRYTTDNNHCKAMHASYIFIYTKRKNGKMGTE
jgi:hypothetical protein